MQNFSSASRDKNVAEQFAKPNGTVLTMKTRVGKDICSYSHHKDEKEVLIPAFVYFLITKSNPHTNPQEV